MEIGGIILGSFLGSFFQVLLDKLISLAGDDEQREGNSTALLNEWKRMLVKIDAVLDDAEDRQLSNSGEVKLWLDDVKDLAYDMEDLVDELLVKAAQVKSETKSSTSRGQVKWRCSCFGRDKSSESNPNLRSLVSETKVKEINNRLKAIFTEKASLNLRENSKDGSHYTNNKRLHSTCLPEPEFFGRKKEEEELLELLTGEAKNADRPPSIIAIVGTGGVGKTALAQQLYNDARVSSYFMKRAWVCVSDVFNVLNITKAILEDITKSSYEDKNFNEVQVKLKENLSGKKYLVVLDDVWNEKYEEWTSLLKPFKEGAKGSKIIITTRNHSVVDTARASTYPLKKLSTDNCTSLLAHHALEERNFDSHPYLETIGKKIAEKCGGLALAAKILGGLLRNKENPDEWEALLNNNIWDVVTEKNDEVRPALKLSYLHLPSYLKRCFTYCAVFPKDYEFERDELALLWIAEGFLDGQKAKENILRLGQKYFDELVSRTFFQQSNVNPSKFLMHDLLNDLAKSIAGEISFTSGESWPIGDEDDATPNKNTRYASFSSSQDVTSRCLRAFHRMKVLRSLMVMPVGTAGCSKEFLISNKVLQDLLTNLKYLRVFSLCHGYIREVPECIGDLKHLRYLNFSYTDIRSLPDSIGRLCKLQALILRGCELLSMLPPGITKLDSLKFLDIRDTKSLKEMPLGIGNLKNLIILSKFVVGPEKGSQLKELKNLSDLQGELFLSELQKVEEFADAVNAKLFEKQDLSNLFFHWGEDLGNLRNDKREEQVLRSLRPHTNLKNLTISNYDGANFPYWLDGSSYSKIESLCLCGCPNVTSLPSLGQLPSLKELSLEGLSAISMIGPEFYGGKRPFSSLTTLKFKEMLAWKDWSCYAEGPEEEVPFSCLQLDRLTKLEILSCPRLNISTNAVSLPSLCELYLENCNKEILKSFDNLTSLTMLKIENLVELVCFDPGFMSCSVKLRELHINGCDKLTYLWQDGNEMRNLTCLQELAIVNCPRFTSFVAGEEEIELPCNLERMVLSNCTSLEKLPSKMHTVRDLLIWSCPKIMRLTIPPDDPSSNNLMSQLESLHISGCDSPTSISLASGRLAALKTLVISECNGVKSLEEITVESLNSLHIRSCENLERLPHRLNMLSHLTKLEIWECPALEIEDFSPLPITLSSLTLWNCPKIKSITSYNNLTRLFINGCPALDCPPTPLPITLSSLTLWSCPNIKSLPNQWDHLTSLQEINIMDCQNINCLPEGGWPPNLQILEIRGCANLKRPVREWGLPLLPSLEQLAIDGRMGGEGEKKWFPSEEDGDTWSLLFPSSLTFFMLENMRNVEGLSRGLRDHLPSLTHLVTINCPKLRDLPEDGLPPSLQRLWIDGCKILKDRCSESTGDCWPLVQEIPLIICPEQ